MASGHIGYGGQCLTGGEGKSERTYGYPRVLALHVKRDLSDDGCLSTIVTIVLSGMEEYIAADPIGFDHHQLLARLQNLSLDWRLSDPFASLVG